MPSIQTGLLWKAGPPPLPYNRSLCRLASLVKKLEKETDHLDEYERIVEYQLEHGIVERVNGEPQRKRVFDLPHKLLIREAAESTKMRIVFDASTEAGHADSQSLIERLSRDWASNSNLTVEFASAKPFQTSCDLKQAFLQVCIQEAHSDALRFHCINDKDYLQVELFAIPTGIDRCDTVTTSSWWNFKAAR